MSPEKFLKQVENLGVVDEELLAKIRRQIANPEKNVNAKGIAKLLVDRRQLTKPQARKLLALADDASIGGSEKTNKTKHDDIVVDQPETNLHDSDMLIASPDDVIEEVADIEEIEEIDEVSEIEVSEIQDAPEQLLGGPIGATLDDFNQPVDENVDMVEVDHVHEVDVDDVQRLETNMAGADYAEYQEPMAEPDQLGQVAYDPFSDPHSASSDASQSGSQPALGFAGKKHAKPAWASKWLFIGPGILGVLVLAGIALIWWFTQTPAEEIWKAATEASAKGEFGVAIDQYDKFLEDYPRDERAGLAKVYRTRDVLAQSYSTKQWAMTYQHAIDKLPEVEELKEFKEIREDLSDILPKTALGFTEDSLRQKDIGKKREILEQAKKAMELVETPSYIPTSLRDRPAVEKVIRDVSDNIREIDYELTMEQRYADDLKKMQDLTEEGNTDQAISIYQTLTLKYKELAVRDPLIAAVTAAAEREKQNVETITLDWVNSTSDVETDVENSLLLATQTGSTAVGLESESTTFLVDGSVYSLNAGSGAVKWRRYVGYQTTIQPMELGDDRIVVVNLESNRVEMLESETGDLIWSLAVGERFFAPVVDGEDIFLTTTSGKVARISAADGSVVAAAQLPQDATAECCVFNGHVLQPGRYSNFYVFSKDDLVCQSINFVGIDHIPGSITIPPTVVSGHAMLIVNRGQYSNLHVFKVTDNGSKLQEVQVIQRFTQGEVNTPMYEFERWLMLASDTGDLKMIGINKTAPELPLEEAASFRFAVDSNLGAQMGLVGYRHYMFANSGKLWIGNRGLTPFRIIKSQNKFERRSPSFGNDVFVGPIYGNGEFLLTIRRRKDSALASVAAINLGDQQEVWRTDLSAPLAGSVVNEGGEVYAVSSQGDKFPISRQLLESGYSGKPVTRGSTILQDLLFTGSVGLSNGNRVFFGPNDRKMILNFAGGDSQLVDLIEPADTPGCDPVALGESLLVASRTGHVARINPATAQVIGTPFLPEVQPDSDISWARPAVLDESRFVIADQKKGTFYLLQSGDEDMQSLHQLDHGLEIKSPLTLLNGYVVAVDFDLTNDRLVSFSANNEVNLESAIGLSADIVAGPMVAGNGVIVHVATNELQYFSSDQISGADKSTDPQWVLEIGTQRLAGPPSIIDDQLVLTMASGDLLVVDSESGEEKKKVVVGSPLANSAVKMGSKVVVGGTDGSIYVVDAAKFSQ